LNRAKEVGIRKVSGALSHELIKQFLLESITISISAFVIAVLVVQGIRPLINNAFGQNLPSLFDLPSWYLVIIFTIVLFASGLSGLYPSLYLAAFKPVKVLKGMFQPGDRTLWLRKGLIVFQFSISIALIAGAAIVFKQVDYIQSKHLGFDKEQVIVIENLANRSKQNVRSLKETIRQINGVSGIASSFAVLGGTHAATDFVSRDSKIRTQINFAGVDENYVRLLGFEFVAGRDFNGTDKILPNGANKVILNETAVNDLGIGDDPIGALIAIEGNDSVYHEVIGVVKDFNFATLRTEIKPYAFMLEENFVTNFVVKTATSDYDQLLKDLEHAWSNSGIPGPFHYFFLDEQIDALYRAEQNFELIFLIFTAISVYIACSGLFAVASYFIKRRTKEIGIRKALGASVSQVTWLVSAGFLRMVIIANLLAWPATWMFMSDWLNGFAYHIDMTWVIFAVSGALALAIAIFTIGGQSVRAAQANPIQSLRNE